MTIPRDTLERQAERIQKLEEPMKFWLLATPYTKYPHGQEAAFWLAVEHRGWRCYICQTQGLPVVLGDSGDVS